MFTGIITHLAIVKNLTKAPGKDLILTIRLENRKLPNIKIGCSIACNGVCLTLVKKTLKDNYLYLNFEISKETLEKTNINSLKKGDKINIEFSLKIGDELGGHFVSGHVDTVSEIIDIKKIASSHRFTFKIPPGFREFIYQKGSIALNGISLTVNEVNQDSFWVNIIPHTLKNTNLQDLQINDKVNLEVDLIARYLHQNRNLNG